MVKKFTILILLVFLVLVVIFGCTNWFRATLTHTEEWLPEFLGSHQKIFKFLLRQENEGIQTKDLVRGWIISL